MRSTDDDEIGVMFRYQDGDNYYRFSWNSQHGYRRLVKNVGGVFTLLAEDAASYVVGQTYNVTVTADGDALDISIDGSPVLSATDSSLALGTIAPYCWRNVGSFFDNVAVSNP